MGTDRMREDRITTGPGAGFVVRSLGTGPGIVVLHGGGATGELYQRLAVALADRFTVHLYDRRGRPGSPPLGPAHTVAVDVDDLAAVLEHTGARNVFGHSGGGFIALRAALRLPLARVAVYDPAVSLLGGFPAAWIDPFEDAVTAGDYPRALAHLADGFGSPVAKLPMGMQKIIGRGFLRTPIGRTFAELMPTGPTEIRQIIAHDGPATDYAGITADVLLAYGTRSPARFRQVCESLADAIPRATITAVSRSAHNAPAIARSGFVAPFASFFEAHIPQRSGRPSYGDASS